MLLIFVTDVKTSYAPTPRAALNLPQVWLLPPRMPMSLYFSTHRRGADLHLAGRDGSRVRGDDDALRASGARAFDAVRSVVNG